METRPFYKRLKSLFWRNPQSLLPDKVTHEYPLPESKQVVRVRRKSSRGKPRNPIIIQEPSSDLRFNHALRRAAWLPRLDLAEEFGYRKAYSRTVTRGKEKAMQYRCDGDKFVIPIPSGVTLERWFENEIELLQSLKSTGTTWTHYP